LKMADAFDIRSLLVQCQDCIDDVEGREHDWSGSV
jgi:hypothetical protein